MSGLCDDNHPPAHEPSPTAPRSLAQGEVLSTATDFVVTLEHLPFDLAVRDAEIAVLEIYLADLIDEIFAEIQGDNRSLRRI